MTSDIAIRVRGLGKRYTITRGREAQSTLAEQTLSRLRRPLSRPDRESFWALKDIELDIRRGDVVGVIGRNGAGKSTLLKVLSRITPPTTGEVKVWGRIGSLLEVGTGFHPELTGRENIFLNGAILGMTRPEIRREFDAIVDFAGVEKFLDTPVKRYSSGMYVRLAFAVAAHLNPEILIVDEVLAVGDAEFQKKCLGKMKDVAAGGRTVLFVSHNMAAVRQLCTTGLLLEEGRSATLQAASAAIRLYITRGRRGRVARVTGVKDELRVLDAGLVDVESGSRTYSPTFGEDCLLFIDFDGEPHATDCGVTVMVQNEDTLVATMSTVEEGAGWVSLTGSRRVCFNLPSVSLLPDRYKVNLTVWKHGTRHQYVHVEELFSFDVEPASVRGSPAAYRRDHGIVRVSEGVTVTAAQPGSFSS